MQAYKEGVNGPLTPLASRQQLLLTDQRLAALESQQADLSIRLIDALGGGYGVNASSSVQPPVSAH
jgi:outer membrane protein TolC